ncbi:MAG TPA: hypothetical protein VGR28_01570, partial [Candidatus Thermoplasmatota archaeon]|nr:hypothetical protein [Candidatus Thermoplasmatota archaeon]
MPRASPPPETVNSGAVEAPTGRKAPEPLIQVDSVGERLAIVAMLVLMGGALLPWGQEPLAQWGPLALAELDLVPLVLGAMALLQVVSTAGKTSNVVMLGLASLGSLGAVAARLAGSLVTHEPIGPGLPILLLGVAL